MEIYLIRHGESLGNVNRVFLGHTDWSLAPLGAHQAEKTAEYLAQKKIDAVYASDLKRAMETAAPFARRTHLPVTPEKRLREISAGKWEGTSFDDIIRLYSEDHHTWLYDIDNARPTGGETVRDLQMRVIACVKELAAQNHDRSIALFTHATPIRALYAALSGKTMASFPWPPNASVTLVRYENGSLVPVSYGQNNFLGEWGTDIAHDI